MRVKIPQLGQIGLVTDRMEIDLPPNAWTNCNNVRFRNDAVESAYGYSELVFSTNPEIPGSAADAVFAGQFLRTGTSKVLVYAADTDADGIADSVLSWDGATETDITGTTAPDLWVTTSATATDYPQMCQLHGNVVLTNGFNTPVYWDGSMAQVSYLMWDATNTWASYDGAGATYTAKIIRAYRQFLIAMDINDDGTRNPRLLHWSSLAVPGVLPSSWDFSDPTNESGRTELAETTGYILDGLQMRDAFVVYKEDAIYTMQYIGGQFVQQFYPVSRDKGILSTNCVVEVDSRHFVLGQRDVYWFDGQQMTSVIEGKIRDELFNLLDEDRKEWSFVAHNIADKEVWVCIPTAGSTYCDVAYVYNYVSGQWSKRDIPSLTCAVLGSSLDEPTTDWNDEEQLDWDAETSMDWVTLGYSAVASTLYAAGAESPNGSPWYEMDVTNLANGELQTKYVERLEINLGDLDQWSMVKRIWPKAEGNPFTVKIGTQNVQEGAVTWEYEGTFTPGTDNHLDCRVSGRYHTLRVESSGNVNWKLFGLDFEVEPVGRR